MGMGCASIRFRKYIDYLFPAGQQAKFPILDYSAKLRQLSQLPYHSCSAHTNRLSAGHRISCIAAIAPAKDSPAA